MQLFPPDFRFRESISIDFLAGSDTTVGRNEATGAQPISSVNAIRSTRCLESYTLYCEEAQALALLWRPASQRLLV